MALPKTIEDREYQAFRECNGNPAKRVSVCQNDGETIYVDIKPKGLVKYVYNPVSSVADNVETKINEYTVPVGKAFDLSGIDCSGENIARFIIKKDGDIIKAKRSYWSDFNADFNLDNLIINAGEKIQVFVVNRGNKPADFESTIMGNEYDVI